MVKFQMVGSENPNTIAIVIHEVDVESFRKDPGWYEIKEEEATDSIEEPEVKVVRKGRPPKKEIQE